MRITARRVVLVISGVALGLSLGACGGKPAAKIKSGANPSASSSAGPTAPSSSPGEAAPPDSNDEPARIVALASADPCSLLAVAEVAAAAGLDLRAFPARTNDFGRGCYYAKQANNDCIGYVTVYLGSAIRWEAMQYSRPVAGLGEQAWVFSEGGMVTLDVLRGRTVLRVTGQQRDGVTEAEVTDLAKRIMNRTK